MRKAIFFLLFLQLFSCALYAQSEKAAIDLKPFLFGKFIDGMVLMKSGVMENLPLNYNTDNQSIFFIKDDQYMEVTGLETIDTVYIQQKRFVPVRNAFYEVIANAPSATLYISYTNKARPMVATTDHSGTTKQANNQVSNTVSDVYVSRNFKGNYTIEISKHFWLEKNNALHKIDNQKQLLKLYPSDEREAIENYITSNAINFNNEMDMIKLFRFCNSQRM